MKYLKYSFNNFTINRFCKANNIFNYKINDDGFIDVKGNVNLYKKNFTKIPIKFNRIDGDFTINSNTKITTLENCPIYVNSFNCGYCYNITTLINGPKYVKDKYECYGCELKDVYGFPEHFYGSLEIRIFNPNNTHMGNRCINPVCEIINMLSITNNSQVKFIYCLNDEKAIRNGNTIIQDRLEEALYSFGLTEKTIQNLKMEFKYYKLI